MSTAVWYRQDAGWLVSARVVETGEFMVFWPVILTMLKLRGGRLSSCALTDFAIRSAVRIPSKAKPSTTEIRDAYIDAGLIVADGDDWVTPSWDEYQPDKRANSRKREESESPSLGRPGTSSASQRAQATIPDVTGPDVTRQTKEGVVVAANTPREAEQAPAEPSPTPTPPPAAPQNEPDLRAACDAYQRAMPPHRGGGVGVFMPPALVQSVMAIAADFGPAMVISAVEASVEAKGHVPGPAYVRRICDRLRAEQNRPAALPFKVAAPQVEEPMSDDEKRDIMARLQALEI